MKITPKGKIALLAILGIVAFYVASRFIGTDATSKNVTDSTATAVDSLNVSSDTVSLDMSSPNVEHVAKTQINSTPSVPSAKREVVVPKQSVSKPKATKSNKQSAKQSPTPTPKKASSGERENLEISNF